MTTPHSDVHDPSRLSLRALDSIGFVGAGAVATTLARALSARGARIVAVASRRPERAAALAADLPGCRPVPDAAAVVAVADLVLLAVPDDAIAPLDAALPWRAGQLAVHFSGARGASALAHAAASDAAVAALHPLMIFPRPAPDAASALARLAGCTWALEAPDPRASERLETLVAALGGRIVRLREADRVPYHLAAVLASNYVVALLGAAVALWQDFGIAGPVALEALVPLLRATVENLAALGPAAALAGPVARGDAGTVAAHMDWLATQVATHPHSGSVDSAALLTAYRALAELAIPLAEARGSLTPDAARALHALLESDH